MTILTNGLSVPAIIVLNVEGVGAALEAEEAQVAPVGAPGVANLPVLDTILCLAPAHNLNIVVDILLCGCVHSLRQNPQAEFKHRCS